MLMALAIALAGPTSATAGTEYAAFEGKSAITEGDGGTKIVKNGVEWWTTGTPPVRFKVVGIITDDRDDDWMSGNAIGSKKLAKLILSHGGQAAIIADRSGRNVGPMTMPLGYHDADTPATSSITVPMNRVKTVLIVVKYIENSDD
jgi:hypothetical protein